jgi:hypothetical protein
MSCYQLKFWINKGYSEEDAKYQISIRRIYNKNYWTHKYGEDIGVKKYYNFITKGATGKKHSTQRKQKNPRCLDYWINKGLSGEDAEQMVSKEQSRFSLEYCVEKYGKVRGNDIFLERQKKWLSSLNKKNAVEIETINNKKSRSLDVIIKHHGTRWVEPYIQEKLNHDNEVSTIAKKCLRDFTTQSDLIDGFKTISKLYKPAYRVLRLKGIQHKFQISYNNIRAIYNKIIKTYGILNHNPTQYGCKITYNDIEYKSNGEYEIAKFLTDMNYSFTYEKPYPRQTKYYYDFYIQKLDLYIEYTGMDGVSFYDLRISKKKNMCFENQFNVIFSKEVGIIKEKIMLYGNKKNNN